MAVAPPPYEDGRSPACPAVQGWQKYLPRAPTWLRLGVKVHRAEGFLTAVTGPVWSGCFGPAFLIYCYLFSTCGLAAGVDCLQVHACRKPAGGQGAKRLWAATLRISVRKFEMCGTPGGYIWG